MKSIIEAIFGELWFDPSIVDLVLWFPHLSWRDFIVSAIAVLSWNWLCDGIWKIAANATKQQATRLIVKAGRTNRRSRAKAWRPPPWPVSQRHLDWTNTRSS